MEKEEEEERKIHKQRSEYQTSLTLSSSSSSSSSSSDFEFTISLSPTKKSPHLCPADELFYKGQLLPLHLSPRISMVRTLLASCSTSSSSDTTTTASRDSTGSSNESSSISGDDNLLLLAEFDSARQSSATEEDFKKPQQPKKSKYFSLSKFSSVFLRKDNRNTSACANASFPSASSKKITATAKEVIMKYVKKVKPLYEKLSAKQKSGASPPPLFSAITCRTVEQKNPSYPQSFSGNLRCPRRRSCISSCPSSIRSSPSHSGVLRMGVGVHSDSSMEELQNAIQGAITHCKNSMVSDFNQKKTNGFGGE